MFIREKRSKTSSNVAIQVVENNRVHSIQPIKQTIVKHLGTAGTLDEFISLKHQAIRIICEEKTKYGDNLFSTEELIDMYISAEEKQREYRQEIMEENANRKKQETNTQKEEKTDNFTCDLSQSTVEKIITRGFHEVYGVIYEELGFNTTLEEGLKKTEIAALFNLVMARIYKPQSKRQSAKIISEEFGEQINLMKIYRTMDKLTEKQAEAIKEISYKSAKEVLKEGINVIYYDCTTLYFESFESDELKEKGFSKDGKHTQVQVLLALIVTQSGLPIGYQIFPGNKFEGDTLLKSITSIRKKYEIDNIIFVADSAMLSKNNIEILNSLGIPYIVGARIKNMNSKIKSEILNKRSYNTSENPEVKIKEIKEEETGRRIIISHSKKRAEKDKYEREKAVEKLRTRLQKSQGVKSFVSNSGYRKFLKIDGDSRVRINEALMEQEAKWDGLHGIITNISDKSAYEIMSQYHGLWQIEETFRLAKRNLKIRPIYHWTPRRIKAHITICYMALVCIRHLEYRVNLNHRKMSPDAIKTELEKVKRVLLLDESTNTMYSLPQRLDEEVDKIYAVVNKVPNRKTIKLT